MTRIDEFDDEKSLDKEFEKRRTEIEVNREKELEGVQDKGDREIIKERYKRKITSLKGWKTIRRGELQRKQEEKQQDKVRDKEEKDKDEEEDGFFKKSIKHIIPDRLKSEVKSAKSLSFWWILILASGFLFYSFVLKHVFSLPLLIILNIAILFFLILGLKRKNYKLLSVIFIIEILFLPQISGFLLEPLPSNFTKGILDYIILLSPWTIYIAIVENPRENIVERLISVLTVVILVFYIINAVGLDTVTAQLETEEAGAVKDRASLVKGNIVNQATGWFGGLFDSSKYSLQVQGIRTTTEPKGVVFSDTEIIRDEFLSGQKITLLKEIHLLTPEEDKSTTVKVSCTIDKNPGEVNENLFELNEFINSKIITCTNNSEIDKTGNIQVVFEAEYNHSTKIEIHPPFIKENSYKNYLSAGQDPFEALGFQSRGTEAYIENGPLNVRFQIGSQLPVPLPGLNQEDSIYGNPIFGLVFEKNNNLQDNVRASWEGKISQTDLAVHLPQGLTFEDGDICGFSPFVTSQECESYTEFVDELNENSDANIRCPSEDGQLQRSKSKLLSEELEKTKDQINVICPLQLQNSEIFFGTNIIAVKPIRIEANYKVLIEDSENIKILKIAE